MTGSGSFRRIAVWIGLVVALVVLACDIASTWIGVGWAGSRANRAPTIPGLATGQTGGYWMFAVRSGSVGGGVAGPHAIVSTLPPSSGLRWFTPISARNWVPQHATDAPFPGGWRVYVPLWIPFILIAVPTALLWRRGRQAPTGHCRACRYDLTGVVDGVCPECGTPIDGRSPSSVAG